MDGPAASLRAWLASSPRGLTREQLANVLHTDDRTVRRMIEDAVTSGELPVVCYRDGGAGRYRIARADEVDLVRREHDELVERGRAAFARARGLVRAHQRHHHAGALFAPVTPDEEAA
jgi:hypothetical protein